MNAKCSVELFKDETWKPRAKHENLLRSVDLHDKE